jgi:hypothetical protein
MWRSPNCRGIWQKRLSRSRLTLESCEDREPECASYQTVMFIGSHDILATRVDSARTYNHSYSSRNASNGEIKLAR